MKKLLLLALCALASHAAPPAPGASTVQPAAPTAPAAAQPAPVQERFIDLFKPVQTDMAALSPDGKYFAYTIRHGEYITVMVVEVDTPSKAVSKVTVVSDSQATPLLSISTKEKTPARIIWMRWITPKRLVVQTNRAFPFNVDIKNDPTWFNTRGEIIAFDADGSNPKSLVTPKETSEWITGETVGNGNRIPRSPYVVDIDYQNPGCIIVQADGLARKTGSRYYERYRLDVTTGKLTSIVTGAVEVDTAPLFDRAGKTRLSIPTSTATEFPHRFEYHSGKLVNTWRRLDELVATPAGGGFSISPQNYFGERSIPLGFGSDADTLYYASNRGRDTYGIYSLNMKTGKPTGLVIESKTSDLFTPGKGSYPDVAPSGHGDTTKTFEDESSLTTIPMITDSMDQVDPQSTEARAAEANAKLASLQGENERLEDRLRAIATAPALAVGLESGPLVFDRYSQDVIGIRFEGSARSTSWFDEALRNAQAQIESTVPGNSVEIIDWNQTKTRMVVKIYGYSKPGAFYIFEPVQRKLAQFVPFAPGLDDKRLHSTTPFSVPAADGHAITGLLTFPHAARSLPVPVVVLCQPEPWARLHTQFYPDAHAIADMGFAVIQVNPRGAWGFGRKLRESAIGQQGAADVEDIVTVLSTLSRQVAINPKKVGIAGSNFGGYTAVRALKLQPERFRCAVALAPIVDVSSYVESARWSSGDTTPALLASFFGDKQEIASASLLNDTDTIHRPVLVMSYRGPAGTLATPMYVRAQQLVQKLKSRDLPAEIYDLSEDFVSDNPLAKEEAYKKIEEFLNIHMYGYKVNLGELKIIKD